MVSLLTSLEYLRVEQLEHLMSYLRTCIPFAYAFEMPDRKMKVRSR